MRPSQPLWLKVTLIQGEAEVVKKGERAKFSLSTPHPPFSSLESPESREFLSGAAPADFCQYIFERFLSQDRPP